MSSPHLSHSVGMSVHDVGHYRGKTFEPGIVLTVDPQLVITGDGIGNLTRGAPLELGDVEAVMREDGLLDRYPADLLA